MENQALPKSYRSQHMTFAEDGSSFFKKWPLSAFFPVIGLSDRPQTRAKP
jgi:hypothetical protein